MKLFMLSLSNITEYLFMFLDLFGRYLITALLIFLFILNIISIYRNKNNKKKVCARLCIFVPVFALTFVMFFACNTVAPPFDINDENAYSLFNYTLAQCRTDKTEAEPGRYTQRYNNLRYLTVVDIVDKNVNPESSLSEDFPTADTLSPKSAGNLSDSFSYVFTELNAVRSDEGLAYIQYYKGNVYMQNDKYIIRIHYEPRVWASAEFSSVVLPPLPQKGEPGMLIAED